MAADTRLFTLSLRVRLLALLLAAFGAMTGLLVTQSLQAQRAAIASASAHLLTQVELIAMHQQTLSARAQALLGVLVLPSTLAAANGSAGPCNKLLATILKDSPDFINLGVALPDGTLLCSGLPSVGAINVADRA